MTTQIFCRSFVATAVGGPSGNTNLACGLTRGVGSTAMTVSSTASGDNIALPNVFWWQVGAGSITGNVTANVRGKESVATANTGAGIRLEHYAADGTTLKTTLLANTPIPATITEYSTTDAAKALASIALTTGTSVNGDLIKITILAKAAGGTMAAGTITNTYDGPSGAAGDLWVTFATTLPVYVPPAGQVVQTAVSGSSLTCAFRANVTAGSFLLAFGANAGGNGISISDNAGGGAGNTWLPIKSGAHDTTDAEFADAFYCTSAIAGATTVTWFGGSADAIRLVEIAGPCTFNDGNLAFISSSTTGGTSAGGGAVTALTGDSMFGWFNDSSGAAGATAGTNYVMFDQSNVPVAEVVEFRYSVASGSQDAPWNSGGSGHRYLAGVVAVTPTVTAPTTTVVPSMFVSTAAVVRAANW